MNDSGVIESAQAERILDLLTGVRLTPTQRRIAHSLVQHAGSAAFLSAAEVAELSRVSQPSVTRFAMALGYDGYPALRRRLREFATGFDGTAGGGSGADGTGRIGPRPDGSGGFIDNEMQRAVRAEAEQLRRLADQLADRDRVTTAGALLAGTDPLPVLGVRAAAPVANCYRRSATPRQPRHSAGWRSSNGPRPSGTSSWADRRWAYAARR